VNDTMITVVGNVVDSPRLVRTQTGSVTNFRLASTARRYDAQAQQYVDGSTLWIDVECWGELSGHVSGSVSKGDPVIVRGEISTHSWQSDDGRRSKPQIRARAVGHNLAKGTALFTKIKPARAAAGGDDASADGSFGDLIDEAYAAGVDPLTGEVVDVPEEGQSGEGDDVQQGIEPDVQRGRDYVDADHALHDMTAGGRSLEPAHA
jgi:single-strand DNA-binding protein